MWTIKYKSVYIHGYSHKHEVRVNGQLFKSLHAAKLFITAQI